MEKQIIITVKAPCKCTDEQFEEWVKYCLGYTASISFDNPLHEYDLDAKSVDIY